MAKRLKLELGFENPYHMLGISTTLNDFRLAHFMSEVCELQFRQVGEISTRLKSGEFLLPLFVASDKRNHIDYFLLPNKKDGAVLFPAERRFDFWLLSCGEGDTGLSDLGRKLQRIPNVQFCFEMDADKLKEASVFFEDLELGTVELLRNKGRISREDAYW